MIVEYTRYKIDGNRALAFHDAQFRALRYLKSRGVPYELTQCTSDRTWYTLRVEWKSQDERRRFRDDSAGSAFRAAVCVFERDVQDQGCWELTDRVHSANGHLRTVELSLPGRWNRLHVWIVEHLHEHITVERMAEQVNMSPRNFARVFRREVLMTPGKYLERVRVTAASKDLAGQVENLQEVALTCGFGSTSTMLRSFLRVLGVGPKAFQAKFVRQTAEAPEALPSQGLMLAESARRLSLPAQRSDATMLS
jgi:AraC-like DNA-binding protein